ncbi:FAD-dependent oxidoreductase [Candidatus Micrarchaeota archaeon]|nr:FAD-dependent oxidoreductase [Candidatus Micrarchaeota archaeon]MBU1930623.1 FAD-dependent oxidoreductase [Candidatus Micrarchaeota archaeon]
MEWKAKILSIKDFEDEGKIIDRVIELECPNDFSFKPGQYVMIAHNKVKNKHDPKQLRWGSMSIASSNHQKGKIELVIAAGEPTGITYFVANKCKKNDYLLLRGAFGVFEIKEPYDELVLVGSGTGLAPLMAMIRSKLDSGEKKPMTLFFGFKEKNLFLFQEELEQLKQKHPNFQFFYITSRELSLEGKQGHVQELLKDHSFNKKKNIQFFLCGPPKAVPDISKTLQGMGFSEKQIHFEQW